MSVSENREENPSLLVWHVKDMVQKPHMGGKCGFEPQLQYILLCDMAQLFNFSKFQFLHPKNLG